MAKQASKVTISRPEEEAWELYEVGANEEVERFAKSYPNHHFIQHLAILAQYEIQGKVSKETFVGISFLSPLVEAISSLERGKTKEAASQISLYFQNSNPKICYNIINLAIKIFLKSENYKDIIHIIEIYKKQYDNHSFIKEEVIAYYNMRNYERSVAVFKANSKNLNDPEIHKVIGMCLLYLNRPNEAHIILESIPGKLSLPSFDEKKKSYEQIFNKIPALESKMEQLSHKELEDIGFAYLFHGEYEKAEKLFSNLTLKLKSTLCTV